MSAILKNHKTPNTGRMCDMMKAAGQLGIIRDVDHPAYNGHIILRTYDYFVSLTDPSHTWSNVHNVNMLVEVLPAGTVVEYGSEI